jgi:hypothetical protein
MKHDRNYQKNLDPKASLGITVHIKSQASHVHQDTQKVSHKKTWLEYNGATILSPLCHQFPSQDSVVQELPLVMSMTVQNPFFLQEALTLEEVYLVLCIFLVPYIQDALPKKENGTGLI